MSLVVASIWNPTPSFAKHAYLWQVESLDRLDFCKVNGNLEACGSSRTSKLPSPKTIAAAQVGKAPVRFQPIARILHHFCLWHLRWLVSKLWIDRRIDRIS